MTPAGSVEERWVNLAEPASVSIDLYQTARVEGASGILLARSAVGYALLLHDVSTTHRAPIVLRNLSVRFNALCQVDCAETHRDERLTIVLCTAPDRHMQATFVQAAAALLAAGVADGPRLGAIVESLVELFMVATRPPQSSILGVWGELFVLSRASDPDIALGSWRSTARDRHDFARGAERVEVKTTVGARRHHFSLEQVTSGPDEKGFVVSVLTGTSAAGASVHDLVTEVIERCSSTTAGDQLMIKVGQALGSDIVQWADQRFDTTLAAQTCRLFEADVIPRPVVEDSRVREVRFVADLTDVESCRVVPAPDSLVASLSTV